MANLYDYLINTPVPNVNVAASLSESDWRKDRDFRTITTSGSSPVSTNLEITYDQKITCSVEETEEKKVAYWVLNGCQIGYGKKDFTFYNDAGDKTVEVVFKGEAGEAEELIPNTTIQYGRDFYREAPEEWGKMSLKKGHNLGTFVAVGVPEEYSVEEIGACYAPSATYLQQLKAAAEEGKLIDDSGVSQKSYIKVVSSKKGKEDQALLWLTGVSATGTRKRYCSSYVIAQDTKGVKKVYWSKNNICYSIDGEQCTIEITED